MQENYVKLMAALDLKNSAKKINQDVKQLEKTVNYLRLTASLYKGESKKQINAVISEMQNSLKGIKLKASINKQETQKALDNVLKDISIGDIKINENGLRLKARKALLNVQSEVSKLPIPINFEIRKQNLQNQLTSYLSKNSKIRESSTLLKEADNLRTLFDTIGDKNSLRIATEKFGLFKSEVTATGFATKSTTDKVNDLVGKLARVTSIFGVLNMGIQKYRQSLTTLKGISTTLTEIAKTSNMVGSELKQLGDDSFGIASKYGLVASNYLKSIQEMARSGYDDMSKELGELSVLAQSAGDMTSEMANNYLLATDAAYKYGGSIDKLTAALDGANYISNRNSATLTDIADATRVSASYAAQAEVEIDQLTAAESTMIAVTKRSGSEMGRAFRSILLNLQKVKGEFDGEIIDDEQLAKVEKRCHDLGVELEVMGMNGAELRNPMQILKELSEVYNSLPDNSVQKQGLISDLGGKYHANALAALLGRWDLYEKMLGEFSQGAGSSLMEAQKTAESWEGRLNALQNQWDSFVNHITDQNMIKGGISLVDNILKSAESLVDTLGAIPTLLTAINGTYTVLNKDYGITQIFNPETNRLDMQGNMFGVDFTAIKAQKQHFIEAEKAILQWNAELQEGKINVEKFGAEIVKNNAQLRAYLSTTSKEAPASLAGYKASLNAAGVSTDALRLKTVLMTSAMTFGLSFALQAAISGISKLMQYQENLRQTTAEAANTYNDSSKSIDDYTARYKELHDALLAAKGNEEETYNVKKQLLDLQTELNDKFGEEYGHLSLVTDAYRDQTDAIKAYNKEAAQKFLNEQEAGIKLAEDKMTEKEHYNLSYTSMSGYSERGQALIEIAKKYKDAGVSLLDETGTGDYSQFSIHLDADAQSAYETIHAFETDVRNKAKELGDEHIFDDVIEMSSASVNNAKKIIDDYGKEYKAGLTANIIADDNLAPQFEKALKAVEAYNEAVLRSENPADDKKVDSAYADLQKIKAGIQENEEEWGRYSSITDDVFAQADTGMYEFRNAIKDNKDGMADLINQFQGKTDTDLLSLSDTRADEGFNKLIEYADEYGLSVNQVIDELIRLETITGEIVKETSNAINPFSKDEMIAAINEMSSGFESLNKIMDSISGKKAFDFSLLDDKGFKETFSGFEDTYTDFVEKISSSPKDINACQSAFDDLLTAWLNSTDVIKGLSDDTADLTINMLSNMGVANAEEVVASALAQKHALLAAEKEYSALTSQKLSDATAQDIADFYNSADATDIAKQSIIQYYIEKQFAAGITLDTSGDVEQLINLVSALGGATDALGIYYNALNGTLNYADISGMGGGDAKYIQQMAQVQANAELEKIKARMSANVVAPKLSGGAKSGGSKKGSGSDKSKKEPTTVDWIETLIDRTTEKIEKLQGKINDAANWKTKNPLTDTSIDEMVNKLEAYQSMYDEYMAKADSIGLPDLYKYKVQNGALEIEDINDENISKMVSEYQGWYDKAKSVEAQIDEVRQSVKELNVSKLDNIINDFDSLCSLMDKLTGYNEKLIEVRKKAGEEIYEEDYTDLIAEQNGIYESLEEEYSRVEAQLNKLIKAGDIKRYSEEWYKYQETLVGIKSSMEDCKDAVLDFREAIVDLRFDELNKFADSIGNANTGLSTLLTILGDGDKLTDGMLTTTGLSALAIYAQQLSNAKQEASEYAEAIKALTEMYDNGDITQEQYTERLYEYQEAQWSAVEATHAAREAILQLKYEAIDQEIEAFQELVNIKKEELDAEEALYRHRKKVQDQTKNIVTLEKKIAELSLSDDRADKAMKLQLEEELAQARQELTDYEREHSLEKQKEALDKEADAFQEAKEKEKDGIKESLEKQDAVIRDYLSKVTDNYEAVYKDLTEKGSAYNMTMTEELTSPWKDAESAANTFSSAVTDAVSKINYDISTIDTSGLSDLINMLNGFQGGSINLGNGDFEDVTGQGTWHKNNTGDWYGNSNDDYVSDGYYDIKGQTYGFNEDGYMIKGWDDSQGDWYYFEPENGQMVKSSWRKSKKGDWYYLQSDGTMATAASIKAQNEDGYYLVDDEGMWDGKLVKKPDFTQYPLAYARGTKNVPHNTPAWINELGEEMVMRPTDDSMLVSLKAHDKVLKADWSDNLFNFASNPSRFISDHIRNIGVSAHYPEIVKTPESSGTEVSIGSLITVEGNMTKSTFEEIKPELNKYMMHELPKQIRSANKRY